MWHAEPHHEATEAVIHIAGGQCGNRGPIWSSAVTMEATPNGMVVKMQRAGQTAKALFSVRMLKMIWALKAMAM